MLLNYKNIKKIDFKSCFFHLSSKIIVKTKHSSFFLQKQIANKASKSKEGLSLI